MKLKLNNLLLFLPLIMALGCNTTTKLQNTYFVGQIINPKEQNVKLFKGKEQLNTSKLNTNQQFNIELENLNEGLYTFKHGLEFQYLYIEPNDSIVMRLNTWDFDESLIFSGKGAEKNNYLIQLFLNNEKDEKLFFKLSKLEELAFIKKTDSLINSKLKEYNKFKEKTKVSSAFNALVQIAIYYPIYSIKEKYTRNYKQHHKLGKIKVVSDSFYDYRKNIDINDIQFIDYYAFNNYVGNYILNLSNKIKENDNSKQFSTIVLKQINNEIKNKKLKNIMLHHAIINCLLDNKSCVKDKNEVTTIFYKNCTDKKKVNNIKTIINSLNLLKKDSIFPNLDVINTDSQQLKLTNIKRNQNLVLYFWPKEVNRIKNMAKRVLYLSNKYPNIEFIGLDNQIEHKTWKAYIKANKLDLKNQYQLVDTVKNKWFTNEIPRALILNKKGIIQNDFSHLSHHSFEKLLSVLEK